jgi:hypothetical protein
LGIATVGLYLTGEKQIGVAQQALTDLERPYLFIVNYNWLLIEKADEHGWKYGVGYAVSNGGKLPAFIRSVEVGLGFGPNIPPLEDQPPINELLTAPLLASGENRVLAQGMADFGGSPRECQIRGGLARIPESAFKCERVIAKITIEYDGPTTAGHVTAACWQWHPVQYAFTQFGGPEHNQRT